MSPLPILLVASVLLACGSRERDGAALASAPTTAPPTITTRKLDLGAVRIPAVTRVPVPAASGLARYPRWVAQGNEGEGIAVSSYAISAGSGTQATGHVQRSSDGGRTWAELWSGPLNLTWIGYAASDAYIVSGTDPAGHDSPVLLESTDRGRTWTTAHPVVDLGARDWVSLRLDFLSPKLAFAVPDPTLMMSTPLPGVLRTNDGGAHWSLAPFAPGSVATGGLDFVTPQVGYATARSRLGASELWWTHDGGSTWQLLSAGQFDATMSAVSFVDTHTGFIAGGNKPKNEHPPWQLVAKTTDGGRSWTTVNVESARPANADPIVRLQMEDALHGWAQRGGCTMGQNAPCGGVVLRTDDGGKTWRAGPVAAMVAARGDIAIALSRLDGVVWTTSDRGVTWASHAAPDQVGVMALQANRGGLFVTSNAGALVSTDGGVTWTPSVPPVAPLLRPTPLAAISLASNDGVLRVSDDGGWAFRDVPAPDLGGAPRIQDVGAADARDILVVGPPTPTRRIATRLPGESATGGKTIYADDPGRLAWTRDGGAAWVVSSAPIVAAVDGRGDHHGVVHTAAFTLLVGRGALAVTTDMQHWEVLMLPTGINCVDASGAGAGAWVTCARSGSVTPDGLLLRTADAGRTWDATSWPSPTIAAVSSSEAWSPDGPGLYHTTDGGRTWVQQWIVLP